LFSAVGDEEDAPSLAWKYVLCLQRAGAGLE